MHSLFYLPVHIVSIFPRRAGEFVSIVSGMILIFNTPFLFLKNASQIFLWVFKQRKRNLLKKKNLWRN